MIPTHSCKQEPTRDAHAAGQRSIEEERELVLN